MTPNQAILILALRTTIIESEMTFRYGLLVFTCLFFASSVEAQVNSTNQIRSKRQEIDKFFQHHDAKQLASLFTSDCHFTSAAIHVDGSDALRESNATLFLKRPDVILVHYTKRIAVNENWDVASEQGEWVERWTEKDGVTELRGTYFVLWRRDKGVWRENDEVLAPETCRGNSYCQ